MPELTVFTENKELRDRIQESDAKIRGLQMEKTRLERVVQTQKDRIAELERLVQNRGPKTPTGMTRES